MDYEAICLWCYITVYAELISQGVPTIHRDLLLASGSVTVTARLSIASHLNEVLLRIVSFTELFVRHRDTVSKCSVLLLSSSKCDGDGGDDCRDE